MRSQNVSVADKPNYPSNPKMIIGNPTYKLLIYLEKPTKKELPKLHDVLKSPRAFYLVTHIKPHEGKYKYAYKVSCIRISPDDEAITANTVIETITASDQYLKNAELPEK
jgi:hypothetical protein